MGDGGWFGDYAARQLRRSRRGRLIGGETLIKSKISTTRSELRERAN